MITLLFFLCFTPLECLALQAGNEKEMVPHSAFATGEKLEYIAKYSFLTIGSMTLEIKDMLVHEGFDCYHFSSVITSNPSLKFLFSLNDTVEVYSRIPDLLPISYLEKINEGKYHAASRLFFDHDSLIVVYNDSLHVDLLADSRDLLSFWYYLRTIDLISTWPPRFTNHRLFSTNLTLSRRWLAISLISF